MIFCPKDTRKWQKKYCTSQDGSSSNTTGLAAEFADVELHYLGSSMTFFGELGQVVFRNKDYVQIGVSPRGGICENGAE